MLFLGGLVLVSQGMACFFKRNGLVLVCMACFCCFWGGLMLLLGVLGGSGCLME